MGNNEPTRERKNKRSRRLRIISSSEDETNFNENDSASRSRSRSPIFPLHRDASPRRGSSPRESQRPASPQPPPDDSQPGTSVPQSEPGTSAVPAGIEQEGKEDAELDEDILMLLGDAPKNDTTLGPPIHKDIASRWQEILAKGLPKENKDKILKDYVIPKNCDLLLPPALNPEAKAALSDIFVKRDISLMNKQKQIGVALSALANVTQLIISNETSKQKLLKPLSDACRILCDSHYMETKTRRNFVVSSVNTQLKDTLIEAERGKFLFGDNVSEKLKIAKTIQRSGEALKHQQKPVFTKSNFALKKGRLNYKQTHRKVDNKPAGDSARAAARPTQRQPPRSNYTRTRKPTDRSPQRRTHR